MTDDRGHLHTKLGCEICDYLNHWSDKLDAKRICEKQITWIDKFGGERSRSEGKKLLNRIIKRLNEEMWQPKMKLK